MNSNYWHLFLVYDEIYWGNLTKKQMKYYNLFEVENYEMKIPETITFDANNQLMAKKEQKQLFWWTINFSKTKIK